MTVNDPRISVNVFCQRMERMLMNSELCKTKFEGRGSNYEGRYQKGRSFGS